MGMERTETSRTDSPMTEEKEGQRSLRNSQDLRAYGKSVCEDICTKPGEE